MNSRLLRILLLIFQGFFLVLLSLGTVACSTKYVALKVTSDPPGADVTHVETGESWGKTPVTRVFNQTTNQFSGPTDFRPIGASVRVEMRGYENQSRGVVLHPEHESAYIAELNPRLVHFIINPLPHSTQAGNIERVATITSDPPGASIFGDSTFWGVTPLTMKISWNPAGSQIEVRFEKPGYVTVSRPLSQTNEKLHVVLQPTKPGER